MATQVQRRRGTTAEHAAFSGQLAETTIDTDKMTVVVQDGTTLGGHPLAKESDLTAGNISITDTGGNFTSTDVEGALAELAVSGGGGGALTYFEESRNIAAPNATVPVHGFTPTGAEANIDALITPKGSGSILADMPDGLSSGGNKRGVYAIDLQRIRFLNTQVASGDYSIIAGGYSHQCEGLYAAIIGGEVSINTSIWGFIGGGSGNFISGPGSSIIGGIENTVTGAWSVCLGGGSNTVDGSFSVCLGDYAQGRGVDYRETFSGNRFSIAGDAQAGRQILSAQTTDATSTILVAGANTVFVIPTQDNVSVLPNNHSYTVFALITARNTATGDTATWKVEGAIKRGANAAATALVGVPTVTSLGADAGLATAAVALIADTTLGAAEIQVTGIAATTIRWVCKFDTIEVG